MPYDVITTISSNLSLLYTIIMILLPIFPVLSITSPCYPQSNMSSITRKLKIYIKILNLASLSIKLECWAFEEVFRLHFAKYQKFLLYASVATARSVSQNTLPEAALLVSTFMLWLRLHLIIWSHCLKIKFAAISLEDPSGSFQFWYSLILLINWGLQAYLGDIAGSLPDHLNKTSIAIKQNIVFFAGGGSCLQFVNEAQ